MLASRTTIGAACVLLLAQAAIIARLGSQHSGALLSDLIQVAIGILCVLTSIQAFKRSGNVARYYWRWLAATLSVWVLAQALGTYIDASSNHAWDSVDDVLFFLSVIPFGMLLFFDPDHEHNRFDRLHVLDFLQVCCFWESVYLYSSNEPSIALTSVGWGPFGLSHSLVFNAVLTISFLLRALLTDSAVVRALFGRMALFLFFSGLADSYASFAPNNVHPGQWFDLVWSALLGIPLVIAATWNRSETSLYTRIPQAQAIVVNQFFPLVYPFFSLLIAVQCAKWRPALSSGMAVVIFAAVGARILIIQRRLLRAQENLQFEATHDALTGLWNHAAILDSLGRELERQRRNGDPIGMILADADHFKKINDTYGHPVGDQVLREIAHRLTGSVRPYDSVGRYGGEEFLIILPNCDRQNTLASAERLRYSVAEAPIVTTAGPIPVAVSIGLVSTAHSKQRVDSSTLLRGADDALYIAKAKGRNRVESAILAVENNEEISNRVLR
jgi:diguanylate cyclase (GGDEF)-like protein